MGKFQHIIVAIIGQPDSATNGRSQEWECVLYTIPRLQYHIVRQLNIEFSANLNHIFYKITFWILFKFVLGP
jgi:hypothetical protein